jgi:hypothetical protein
VQDITNDAVVAFKDPAMRLHQPFCKYFITLFFHQVKILDRLVINAKYIQERFGSLSQGTESHT